MAIVVRPARPEECARLGDLVVAAYEAIGALEGDDEYVPELRDVAAGSARRSCWRPSTTRRVRCWAA
jgi:hypothetical protein